MTHRTLASRLRRATADGGFTVIELVITVSLASFVFIALASMIGGAMRTLGVAKARTQGNEVATDGIEDLQRYAYDQLGLCASPEVSPPAGLTNIVYLPNCPAGSTSSYGETPCSGTSGMTQVPASAYTCQRIDVTFSVRRYVVWADTAQTAKRLAVFVSWTDQLGPHTVSQQSSVRAPQAASAIGLSPPTLLSPTINPSTATISSDGSMQSSLTVSVAATGLCGTTVGGACAGSDRVFVELSTLDADGNPEPSSFDLAPNASGSQWSGTITGTGESFGPGSQFVTIVGMRKSDGKSNVLVVDGVRFCPSSDPTCSTVTLPSFIGSPTVPATVSITASGALNQDITVSATLRNLTTADTVLVGFETLAGFVSVALEPSASCTTSSCTFSGTISKAAGYAFAKGSRPLYFSAQQVKSTDPTSVDQGSTVALASSNVSFG